MISQSATIKRAITLGEILDVEACGGMLHAEFHCPVTNRTITVESTLHGAEIQPIALYLSRSPDTFVPASELLSEQEQSSLTSRLSDHLAACPPAIILPSRDRHQRRDVGKKLVAMNVLQTVDLMNFWR